MRGRHFNWFQGAVKRGIHRCLVLPASAACAPHSQQTMPSLLAPRIKQYNHLARGFARHILLPIWSHRRSIVVVLLLYLAAELRQYLKYLRKWRILASHCTPLGRLGRFDADAWVPFIRGQFSGVCAQVPSTSCTVDMSYLTHSALTQLSHTTQRSSHLSAHTKL